LKLLLDQNLSRRLVSLLKSYKPSLKMMALSLTISFKLNIIAICKRVVVHEMHPTIPP